MKNYIIGLLAVIIMVLASILYKKEALPRYRFPVLENTQAANKDAPLYLYVFFSKNNCPDCLEIIDVLNQLPPHFAVFGIVPENELRDENELRRITKAAFPLLNFSKYKKYVPWDAPTIVGVSPAKGDILFILPGVPGEKDYLGKYLDALYPKIYTIPLTAPPGNTLTERRKFAQ